MAAELGQGKAPRSGWQRAEVGEPAARWLPVALEWGQQGGDVAAGSSLWLLPSFEGCYGRIQPSPPPRVGAGSRGGMAGLRVRAVL